MYHIITGFNKFTWLSFGDIILENLKTNIKENTILCQKCGKRVTKVSNCQIYCDKCSPRATLEIKTIICVDCGSEVMVDSKANNRSRCNDCTNNKKRTDTYIRVKKYRNKNL